MFIIVIRHAIVSKNDHRHLGCGAQKTCENICIGIKYMVILRVCVRTISGEHLCLVYYHMIFFFKTAFIKFFDIHVYDQYMCWDFIWNLYILYILFGIKMSFELHIPSICVNDHFSNQTLTFLKCSVEH
jgi:hypothetical protein